MAVSDICDDDTIVTSDDSIIAVCSDDIVMTCADDDSMMAVVNNIEAVELSMSNVTNVSEFYLSMQMYTCSH